MRRANSSLSGFRESQYDQIAFVKRRADCQKKNNTGRRLRERGISEVTLKDLGYNKAILIVYRIRNRDRDPGCGDLSPCCLSDRMVG